MRVLVNAISIREGGSRVVLEKLLSGMQAARPDIEWIVAAHPIVEEALSKSFRGTFLPASWNERSALQVLKWYDYELCRAVERWRPDILFSQTNYLPHRRVACPTLLLEQHAGHFSPEFDKSMREELSSPLARAVWALKRRWVFRSVEIATSVTVQTAALADRMCRFTRRRDGIQVIPHGPGLVEHLMSPRLRPRRSHWRIGYVANYGVQKNFQTLFRAIRALSDAGREVSLVLTLDENSAPAKDVLRRASEMGIAHRLENRGKVTGDGISDLYDSLDVFVFSSTCESFGLPMVEAMARGLPILVAATPENLEIAGRAGLAFPPYDSRALAEGLARLMDDSSAWEERASMSLARSRDFSWRVAAEETVAALERTAGRRT